MRCSPQDRGKVESIAVHSRVADVMPQAVQHQPSRRRMLTVDGVSAARFIQQASRGIVAIIRALIQTPQGEYHLFVIVFSGVVEHHIQKHSDAFGVQARHHFPQIVQSPGRQTRVQRHEVHGVVTPPVAQAQLPQVRFVDPRLDRHQFHRAHPQVFEVPDHRRMQQSPQSSPQLVRHFRVKHREGTHGNFVNQTRR